MPDSSPLQGALKRSTQGFYLAVALSCVINLLMLTQPIFMLQVFNRVLPSMSRDTLMFLIVIAMGALAVLGALFWLRSKVLNRIGMYLEEQTAQAALEHGVDPLLNGQAYGPQALRDLGTIRQFVQGPGALALLDIPWTPLQIGVIFLLHPTLGAVALIAAVGLVVLALANERLTKKTQEQAAVSGIKNQRFIETALRNAEVTQAMGMLPAILSRWRGNQTELNTSQLQTQDVSGAIQALAKFFRLAIQVVIMASGVYLVLANELTPGGMIAASIIMGRGLSPLENSIVSWKHLISARAGYNRLQQHFASPTMRQESPLHLEPKGHLTVEGISFAFPGQEKATLEGVSFAADAGEALAIIGPSASGKTTLAKCLVGVLKPLRGAVRLDTKEVYSWERQEFGQYVGYLPQNIELFPGTVAENIGRMDPDADEKKIIEASQLAGAHELILRLPHGYQTQIGPDGAGLSGGQQQRIGLARTFYGVPKFVLLDEPNSSLDDQGIAALCQGIKMMKELGSTVVMITHSKGLLSLVERTVVLRDGKVHMWGPTKAVFEKLGENS